MKRRIDNDRRPESGTGAVPNRPASDAPRDAESSAPAESEQVDRSDGSQVPRERPLFHHPQWTLGVVLVFAVAAVVAGLGDPVWLLIGSPFILALGIYIWVRLTHH